ncbi:MAG: hypothetical protein ABI906_10740 [Pseudomonadota bacterium]
MSLVRSSLSTAAVAAALLLAACTRPGPPAPADANLSAPSGQAGARPPVPGPVKSADMIAGGSIPSPPKPPPPVEGPPAPAEGPPDIHQQLAGGQSLPVVYRHPAKMTVDRSERFWLVVASKDFQEAVATAAQTRGDQVVRTVKLADTARATLEGDPGVVEIHPEAPPDQPVTRDANVEWSWTVRPKAAGDLDLTLRLFNIVQARGGPEPVLARPALVDHFKVQATPAYLVTKWNPVWTALFGGGGIVVVIAGWLGWKRASQKS